MTDAGTGTQNSLFASMATRAVALLLSLPLSFAIWRTLTMPVSWVATISALDMQAYVLAALAGLVVLDGTAAVANLMGLDLDFSDAATDDKGEQLNASLFLLVIVLAMAYMNALVLLGAAGGAIIASLGGTPTVAFIFAVVYPGVDKRLTQRYANSPAVSLIKVSLMALHGLGFMKNISTDVVLGLIPNVSKRRGSGGAAAV